MTSPPPLGNGAAEVTMLQRSSTLVAPLPALERLGFAGSYSEQALAQGITPERSDLAIASIPYRLLPRWQKPIYDTMRLECADLYARLAAAGFMLDFGDDDFGVFVKFLRRGSGYYLDVGASDLVADGRIRLRSRVTIERLTPHTVVLSDGSELKADLVVYARLWLDEPLSGRPDLPRGGREGGQGVGFGFRHYRKDPGPWGKGNCATCGSPPKWRTSGSMAAIYTSAATIRSTWPCNSRPA